MNSNSSKLNPSWQNPTGLNLLILLTIGITIISLFYLNISQILPLVMSFAISAGLGYVIVPQLQKIKASQVIQEDGPSSHLKKAGTPTMGGIFFIPVAIIVGVTTGGLSGDVVAVGLMTFAYAFIGWVDDWQILRKKTNLGLTAKQKLALQIIFAVVFCAWLWRTQPHTITTVELPFNLSLSVGFLFWFLATFVIVAESNATNLTDGVDGLAGGTGAITFLGLGILMGEFHPDLQAFALALSGACLGFVVHNRNKASVFMGDTGSLALGAGLAGLGILSQNLWALFIISLIFFVESLSVIAQVGYYKATKGADGKGKRLLKMAPLHHHLELSGWSETQIVGIFYLVNTILILVTIF
ncbi:MAG: phospho-N-acetylmuramoyl-pentapeptide-transferase [Cyanobacterium sp. T60_A2020_053]|nr:phospho-N-acetylmuramoyl-pentapeptide-transferase [Cyanobacterium sp. T60_A2020_053]